MRAWLSVLALTTLGGCDLSMTRQDRHAAQGGATLWPNGPAASGPPALSVAQDAIARDTALARPPALDLALLRRGQARYAIYCAPCHGGDGSGRGTIVQRGFPRPPDYRSARVRALTPPQVVDVIGRGYGLMYGFADRIAPRDRWAIAAYVRTLGRTEHGG